MSSPDGCPLQHSDRTREPHREPLRLAAGVDPTALDLDAEGGFTILPTTVGVDDYIDLRAEMNVLAAVSACPADTSPTNAGKSAPLGIKVFAPG